MTLEIPLKQIFKIKVPGVLALALMAGQLVLTNLPGKQEPKCVINVERPHTSTYMKERKSIDSLKLNIVTRCDSAQKYTILNADIQAIKDGSQVTAHKFLSELRTPTRQNLNEVRFLNLQKDCFSRIPTLYLGRAQDEIHLQNGKIIKVAGDSKYFFSQDCEIDAK
jgi:hypothetical protein